jgi:hypothetical protein
MATIIKVDGAKQNVEPKDGKIFSLKELQEIVNGYIELIPLDGGRLMVVDEEGKLKADAQLNIEASRIANQRIVGDVIMIDKDQIE